MNNKIKNIIMCRAGVSEFIETAVSLAISVVIGAIVMFGMSALINGKVSTGIEGMFEKEQAQTSTSGKAIFSKDSNTYETVYVLMGDVNSDGSINSSDYNTLSLYLTNTSMGINVKSSDLNKDGTIDSTDLDILSTLLSAFPNGEMSCYNGIITSDIVIDSFDSASKITGAISTSTGHGSAVSSYSSVCKEGDGALRIDYSNIYNDGNALSFFTDTFSKSVDINDNFSDNLSFDIYISDISTYSDSSLIVGNADKSVEMPFSFVAGWNHVVINSDLLVGKEECIASFKESGIGYISLKAITVSDSNFYIVIDNLVHSVG